MAQQQGKSRQQTLFYFSIMLSPLSVPARLGKRSFSKFRAFALAIIEYSSEIAGDWPRIKPYMRNGSLLLCMFLGYQTPAINLLFSIAFSVIQRDMVMGALMGA